jgi:opacity protein-like surface antigen
LHLTVSGGWATTSDVNTTGGTLEIGDTSSWGAAIGTRAPGGVLAELRWVYLQPENKVRGTFASDSFKVATHYILVSGSKGLRRGRVEPFISGALGTVAFAPETINAAGSQIHPDTTWRMAFGLGAGLNVAVAQRLALRFSAEMLGPILFDSAGFYVGTGGSGMAVSGGIPCVTGNFTVGLTLML